METNLTHFPFSFDSSFLGDGSIPGGSTLVLNFSVQHPGTNLPAVRALRFNGVAICEQ